MLMPQSQPPNADYDIEQLLQTVSQLETVGLLEDFLTSHPQYVIGIEVARALLDRSRSSNPANSNGACGKQVAPLQPAAQRDLVPSAPSVRYFVTLLSRLLEDQCPNRADPQLIASEDRCLAALQMAIVDALKTVRQRRLSGGHSGLPIPHGEGALPPSSGCQRPAEGGIPPQNVEGYSQFQRHPTETHVLAAGPPGENRMNAPLHQRLEQITEPIPCQLQHPGDHPQMYPRPAPDSLTLEQRLQTIPQPLCHHLECQGRRNLNKCGGPFRSIHSHERETVEKFFDPVAGGWSDGMGGHKIKNYFDNGKRKNKNTGDDDGVGGRKVKGFEDE